MYEGFIELREINSGNAVRSWKGHEEGVWGLVFPSDGGLVSGSGDGYVKRCDLETGREVWARDLGGGFVHAMAELPGGRVAAGCGGGTVRVLDFGTGQEIMVCRGHTRRVFTVISLGDLRAGSFASGSYDETIRVWASDGTPGRVVEVGSRIYSLSLSPCGGAVAAGCRDGSVRLFRLPEWDTVWTMKVHTQSVRPVSFSPDGRFLASGSLHKGVKILSPETGAVLRTLEGHNDEVWSVLFSQDGTKVLSGSANKNVRVLRIFCRSESKVRALCGGLVLNETTVWDREALREVTRRATRLFELDPQEPREHRGKNQRG
jgi:outer membrane protein assembly factor BamB